MKKMDIIVIGFLLVLFSAGFSAAGDYGYENTSEGIVKGLLQPERIGIVTRGLAVKKEVLLIEENNGSVQTGTAKISAHKTSPFVNIKIEFDTDSAEIRQGSYSLLRELGEALMHPSLKGKTFNCIGHTDSDGSNEYNLELSLKRAQAVRTALVRLYGIGNDMVKCVGYGEQCPVVPNVSESNKQLNRRVEFAIR